MNLYKRFEVDKTAAAEGVRIPIEGSIFICRRAGAGNRRFRAALQAASARHRVAELDEATPEAWETEDLISLEAFTNACIVDWENVDGRDDQPLPFTPENFKDLMTACPDLWAALRSEAGRLSNYQYKAADKEGTALGN